MWKSEKLINKKSIGSHHLMQELAIRILKDKCIKYISERKRRDKNIKIIL